MREILVQLIEQGLKKYRECLEDHTPNTITTKILDNVQKKKGFKKAYSVEELFKKLSE